MKNETRVMTRWKNEHESHHFREIPVQSQTTTTKHGDGEGHPSSRYLLENIDI